MIWLNNCWIDEDDYEAWDCDPDAYFEDMSYDLDLNEEDDTGDWQAIVLDRFGDRFVNPEY